jgi:hypothetical protein
MLFLGHAETLDAARFGLRSVGPAVHARAGRAAIGGGAWVRPLKPGSQGGALAPRQIKRKEGS